MLHELTFDWIGGETTAADHMIKLFKARGIPFRYDYFQLCAALNGSDFVPVEYYKIDGCTFGIVEKPRRLCDVFGITPEEAMKDMGYSYTKEDCIALDHNPDANPFAFSLRDALEKADHYRRAGHENVQILRAVFSPSPYYVIC